MKSLKLFFILFCGRLLASHIVGGELSIQQQTPGHDLYEITLTLVFDEEHGNPESESNRYPVRSFNKANNKAIQQVYLYKQSNNTYMEYKDLLCMDSIVKMRIIKYMATVVLDPSLYTEASYWATEVCCRNGVVRNVDLIKSSGYVFYAEFPALKDTTGLVDNSSPQFSTLVGYEACLGKEVTMDFSAKDKDGDSLAYELVNPINGHAVSSSSNTSLPDPVNPAPYSRIAWKAECDSVTLPSGGYMQVNEHTGEIKFKSWYIGLYLFSVKCSEYRKGIKLGEVRRDYQVWVINCPNPTKPSISWLHGTDPGALFTIKDINTKYTVVARDSVQRLNIIYEPINFNSTRISSDVLSKFVMNRADSLSSSFNWVGCMPNDPSYIYQMRVIARNRACPRPSDDTLLVRFKVEVNTNKPPVSSASHAHELWMHVGDRPDTLQLSMTHDDSAKVVLDEFTRSVVVKGSWNLQPYGFQEEIQFSENRLNSRIVFSPSCDVYLRDSVIELQYIGLEHYCSTTYTDTLRIKYHLLDKAYAEDSLKLVNIFTPNGDQLNDYLYLKGMPPDRCNDAFQKACIYNRWGHKVYEAADRHINWSGADADEGVYFYEVKYQKSQYRGQVELRR